MLTGAPELQSQQFQAAGYRAATDPIEPIREYTIPIPPYKHPPGRDDFDRRPRRQKKPDIPTEQTHIPPPEDGHIDEYA